MGPRVRALLIVAAVVGVAAVAGLLLRSGPPAGEAALPVEEAPAEPAAQAERVEPEARAAPPAPPTEPESEEPGQELPAASVVPHRVLRQLSHDVVQDVPRRHRLIIAVVEPEISTRDLERLARDLRSAHGDASILDVRIYDAEHAAREGGVLETLHRVAEVRRNDRIGLDVVRIRGIPIEP
jgi:hypothetical protein